MKVKANFCIFDPLDASFDERSKLKNTTRSKVLINDMELLFACIAEGRSQYKAAFKESQKMEVFYTLKEAITCQSSKNHFIITGKIHTQEHNIFDLSFQSITQVARLALMEDLENYFHLSF